MFGKRAVPNPLEEWADEHGSRVYVVLGARSRRTCSVPVSALQNCAVL